MWTVYSECSSVCTAKSFRERVSVWLSQRRLSRFITAGSGPNQSLAPVRGSTSRCPWSELQTAITAADIDQWPAFTCVGPEHLGYEDGMVSGFHRLRYAALH